MNMSSFRPVGNPDRFAPVVAQRGLSLVELMIALVIGMLIVAGVTFVFMNSRQTYTYGNDLARIQEDGRFAINALNHDLRMTALPGCVRISNFAIVAASPVPSFDKEPTVTGDRYLAGHAYALTIAGASGVPSSDVFTIRRLAGPSIRLSVAQSGSDPLVFAQNTIELAQSDLAIISDCNGQADLFRVSSVAGSSPVTIGHAAPANSQPTFGSLANPHSGYTEGISSISKFLENSYFVADTGRTNQSGQAVTSLFKREVNGSVTELIEGVQDMRVFYGVNSDAANDTVDQYLPVQNMTNALWQQVIALRVDLLLRAREDNTLSEAQSYTLLDGSVLNDRRVRTTVSTTISLRNLIP